MLSRKIMNTSFSLFSILSIVLMTAMLLYLLLPIFWKGAGAILFRATVEHRRSQVELFHHGDAEAVSCEVEAVWETRNAFIQPLQAFQATLDADPSMRRKYGSAMRQVFVALHQLFGAFPDEKLPALDRDIYGQTRWDRALIAWNQLVYATAWLPENPDDPASLLVERQIPRSESFRGTTLESFFTNLNEETLEELMRPQLTFYWRFLTEKSKDSHFFGGIGAEVLGTIYLTLGAMLFAVPMGVIAAIYLAEYAKDSWCVSLLRTCIGALAGVPSIVFGLFGLVFFLNTLPEWVPFFSAKKNIVAGSMTLALLILPTIIRAAEEAIRSVPHAYKEAAMGLGASRWRAIVTVIIPAALPGILTGVVISMGRAAGETAPIIFTAAISMGDAVGLTGVFSNATPALPWNIYNLCSEHEAVEEVRHVQYGMVLTLVAIVLLLNMTAIWLRARIARKMRG